MPDPAAPAQQDTPLIQPRIFELASILRDAWQPMHERLVASGVPLNETPPTAEDPPAPEGTPGTPPPIDYEKRYNDLRPEYDRKAAAAAEYERLQSDPAAQQAFLAQLGYEIEEEPSPVYDDPTDELRAEIAAANARIAQQEQRWESMTAEQQQQAALAQITSSVEQQFAALGAVDDAAKDWIQSHALVQMPPREDGTPDIEGAHKAFNDLMLAQQKTWASTKRAPRIPSGGAEGAHAPNLDNRQDRIEWMAQELAARDTD